MKEKIAVVGAGFAGAVMAEQLSASGRFHVTVFDERDHVAGNCHSTRDAKTGIMLHHFGPHIFNTSRQDVWDYVNRFGEFGAYTNRVKAVTDRGVFSLPINLHTINQFFSKKFNPKEAQAFIEGLGDATIAEPKSFEEQALKFLGLDLYETFFRGYTKKQWGVDPKELPASILKRLPVRFSYDDNYYSSRYQGIPRAGYTALVGKILDRPEIELRLGQRFSKGDALGFRHVFYSGPMDAYFNFSLGRLQYRTLRFERIDAEGDYQGNAVINYCQEDIPYTRIAEHKHFAPWEEHANTVCYREYSALAGASDTPYYPLRLSRDKILLEKYTELADAETGVTFIGRLGTYRYLDMHVVIGESLDLAKLCLTQPVTVWPRFSASPVA